MMQNVAGCQSPLADAVDPSKAGPMNEVTTLMFRHLPRKYTAWDLLSVLEQHVTRAALDFVYIPWDGTSTNNMGFAFVNFVDAPTASMMFAMMQGTVWPKDSRMRQVRIVPSLVQGAAANLARYRDTVKEPNLARCPLIFNGGTEIPLHIALRRVQQTWPCGTWGKGQVSAMGTAHVTLASRAPACIAPPPPPGLESVGAQAVRKGWSDNSSNASTTCGSLPSFALEQLFVIDDARPSGHCMPELWEPAEVHSVTCSSPFTSSSGSCDGLFEGHGIASRDSSPLSGAEELASLRRNAVQKSPEYAAACFQVHSLLLQLQQAGVF